jgi:hypothetical protein
MTETTTDRPRFPDGSVWFDVWVVLLCIVAALTVNTWFVPTTVSYLASGVTLTVAGVYVLLVSDVEVRIDVPFAALFGGYWLALAAGWFVDLSPTRLLYVAVTPLSVVVTVFLLTPIVDRHREAFVSRLTGLGVLVAAIGFGMLFVEAVVGISIHRWTGGFVYGVYGFRTNSVFANPNTYGFLMMVCTLSAAYLVLNRRRGVIHLGAFALCGAAVVTSDSTAALLGAGFGFAILSVLIHRLLPVVLFTGAVAAGASFTLAFLGLMAVPYSDRVQALTATLLSVRVVLWQASIERLLADPLVGIGFADTAVEIQPYISPGGPAGFGTHNSYVHILLQTGVVAGSFYLFAVFYAAGKAAYAALTRGPISDGDETEDAAARRWSIYVVAVLGAILVALVFESMTIGGLSLNSVLVGLFLGLALSLHGSWLVTVRPDDEAPSPR